MKKFIGYIAAAAIASMFTGTAAFAAGTYVQAQRGSSVIQLNGQTVSSPPKLIYDGTTYVQLYSIQSGLQSVFGVRPTWDGTNFNIITPASTSSTIPAQSTTGSTSDNSAKTVKLSELPYTYKSPNGMQITFNKVTADSSGTVINITLKNGGKVDTNSSYMSTSNIDANNIQVPYVSQDQSLYNNFNQLHPGESVTGNVIYSPLPAGATTFTLYYDLVEYIDFDHQVLTFDLSK